MIVWMSMLKSYLLNGSIPSLFTVNLCCLPSLTLKIYIDASLPGWAAKFGAAFTGTLWDTAELYPLTDLSCMYALLLGLQSLSRVVCSTYIKSFCFCPPLLVLLTVVVSHLCSQLLDLVCCIHFFNGSL